MKKILCVIIFVVFLLPVGVCPALAYSDSETESLAEAAGADEISNELLDKDELSGDKNINLFEKVAHIVVMTFNQNGNYVLRSFGSILGVLVLCCIMRAMKFGESPVLDNAGAYISVLALSGVTYSVIYNLFVLTIASMESLNLAVSALVPTMGALYVFGGCSATGAASASALSLFLSVLSIICTKVILPFTRVSFALSLSGALPNSVNLTAVTNLIKNCGTMLLTFIFSMLGFVMVIQTSVAAASDTFVTRSVKFASGTFVPIIGNMLGEASRTVIASVSLIKGTVGASGTVIILSAVLPTIITVTLHKLALLVCGIIAKSLGCENESTLLYDLGGILNILLALVIGAGTVALIAMAVFLKARCDM